MSERGLSGCLTISRRGHLSTTGASHRVRVDQARARRIATLASPLQWVVAGS